MRIAIDAMGGDNAPDAIIAGCLKALDDINNDSLVLIGDEAVVKQKLGPADRWQKRIELVHAPESIPMDAPPVEGLRRMRNSSINIMSKLAAERSVDVVISAGNTGACVAACQMRMRLLPGVQRPGILVVLPTFQGPLTLLDVGANIAPKASHLHQYALMGAVFTRQVLNVANPRVGLISIGQEDAKGNELVKKVNQLLWDDPNVNFIGNVEPREVLNRPADVIVCDGFVGNVILKLTEGIAEGLFKAILAELAQIKPDMIEHFRPVINSLYAKHDYNEYGGAPLLGVDGICIICHGSSDPRAIRNAILRARQQAQLDINQKIAEQIASVPVDES
ncbi:MAG: phosphate acyltransferase PlsX [Sedimentisphaerales bacterium]|nr:phosphate acyltransferase PlsX [Sedimentisphaerales bacterium]